MNGMTKGQLDPRGSYDRAGWTETTCDICGEVILESEERHRTEEGRIICQECQGAPTPLEALRNVVNDIKVGKFKLICPLTGRDADLSHLDYVIGVAEGRSK